MQLRDYQIELSEQAKNLLLSHKIAILSMQVRTGKTATALNAAKLYGAKKVLFVTKKKAIGSIQADFEDLKPGFDLFLTNYESLHKCAAEFDLVIIDESHSIGAYPKPSERTKELKRICKGIPIMLLSGTLTPESYCQIYHQLWPSSFTPFTEPTFYKWHSTYGIPATKFIYGRQVADYSKCKPEAMQAVNHLMLTYTQDDAGFECPVEETVMYVPMSEKIKWAVDKIRRNKIFITKDGETILGDTAVKE